MTLRSDAVAKANELRCLHSELKSWRKIAELYYPGVAAGTLSTIAKSGGRYVPKDKAILKLLGLEKKPKPEIAKQITALARDTADAVVRRKPVKKEYDAVTKEGE